MIKRFLSSELEEMSPNKAFFHVIPVPYEETVSYGGGTKNGPDAILEASDQLELWDNESVPAELGIYTHEAVNCDEGIHAVFKQIKDKITIAAKSNSIPFILGGEHSISYGAFMALKERCDFGIIQFDAHADLRHEYEGSIYSHACVMRRAVQELGIPLVQFGVRAFCKEEIEARKTHNVTYYDAQTIYENNLPNELIPANFPKKVYLSFDIDGLDGSLMPATGTPVPGGLDWYTALNLVKKSLFNREVVGVDLVEFAPIKGFHAYDFMAARLAYALMGIVQRSKN